MRFQWLCLAVMLGVVGCASGGGGTDLGTPVQITDLKTVAGRWAGLVDLPGSRNPEEFVEVTVRADGTYQASSARTIGAMDAQGTVEVSEGRLLLKGQRNSRGVGTLYAREGRRTLVVEITGAEGRRSQARLEPKP